MRVLIADDEPHVCLEVESILKEEEKIEIIAICYTGDEALESICKLNPDVVFLDISMPGIDGIKLGHYLKQTKIQPYIIYLTAYDKFAVDAFKVGAKGYILKPFMDDDIKEQIALALDFIEEKRQQSTLDKTIGPNESESFTYISGKYKDKIIPINQHELLMAYAQNREVFLRANDQDYGSNFSLTQLKSKLSSINFFHCHRNYIVNLDKVKEVIPWFNGTYMLVMNDAMRSEVPVSRSNVKELKRLLNM